MAFDRAAEFYDATRTLPPETLAAALEAIVGLAGDRGRLLEIGVGTGRIALPLAAAGLDVTGVDLSFPMVSKLLQKSGGPTACRVALADATHLPFAEATFGAGLGVHVLHLIGDWRRAVAELVRVVRPGGVLLFDVGASDTRRSGGRRGPAREIEERFQKEAGLERRHPGLGPGPELDEEMASHGARALLVAPIRGALQVPPALIIRMFEENVFSWTWPLAEDRRRAVAASVREWAAAKFGDLNRPREEPVVVAIRAYELPDGA